MKKLVYGLAASSLLFSATAFAAPTPLANSEMDRVSAGFLEIDTSNTSYTYVSLFQTPSFSVIQPNTEGLPCTGCYILIVTPRLSLGSRFGP
jgi:hypothetical protein